MATAQDWIDDLRQDLVDPGDTVVDSFTGDGTTKIVYLSQRPIKTDSEIVTLDTVVKSKPSDFSIDYDKGEVTFVTAPGVGVVAKFQYTKVHWRDEKMLDALKEGVRHLFPRVYKAGEAYVRLRTNISVYDLSNTTDVPNTDSEIAEVNSTDQAAARVDLVKAQSRIHFAEFKRLGDLVTDWEPFIAFFRPIPKRLTLTRKGNAPSDGDMLRLHYTAPFTPPTTAASTIDVHDDFYDLPKWYAMGSLLAKQEAVRARADRMSTAQNENAVREGASTRAGADLIKRYYDFLAQNAMRPMAQTIRRRA